MAFDEAAVTALYAAAVSRAQKLSVFERVSDHEPKSPPGAGLSCSFAGAEIRPVTSSGLASTSGVVVLTARIYKSRNAKPEGNVDPEVFAAASALIGAFSEDFTVGGTVREVDLLGQFGTALSARLGWLDFQNGMWRVGEITIPFVVDDMWQQGDD